MKIWVTGANGQLGQCFQELKLTNDEHEFIFTSSKDLDITNEQAVKEFVTNHQPKALINCAAYTKVDAAEKAQELCFKVNETAVANLAKVCLEHEIFLLHFSTDYVFDGEQEAPYLETDLVNPLNVYAASKAAGEAAIQKINPNAVIIRTSWVFSHYGNNFVKTILRLASERDELNIVADQVSCPTFALDLAKASLAILSIKANINGTEILHFSNSGYGSWCDFAQEIVAQAGLNCEVSPIATEGYPLPAKRPKLSLLSIQKFKDNYYTPPIWETALEECLKLLKRDM